MKYLLFVLSALFMAACSTVVEQKSTPPKDLVECLDQTDGACPDEGMKVWVHDIEEAGLTK